MTKKKSSLRDQQNLIDILKDRIFTIGVKTVEDYSIIRNSDPDNEWDRDDIAYDIKAVGLYRMGETDFMFNGALIVNFEIEEGKSYFLVSGTYSTGDSFHVESGRKQWIDLYRSEDEAIKAADAIYKIGTKMAETARSHGINEWTAQYPGPLGVIKSFNPEWLGYFERLESVDVTEVSLEEN